MNLFRVIGLALLLGSSTWANTIILTGLQSNLGLQQSLYFDEDGVSHLEYWAGAIDVTVDGYARLVFCVDLFTNITFGTYGTTLDYSDSANQKRADWLISTQLPTVTTQDAGAALQLAIWDIMTDSGDGFAPGAGRVTQSTDVNNPTDATVLAAAANFEAISVGKSSTMGIIYHNVSLSSGTPAQTLMSGGYNDGGPQPKTPEPTPIILMVSGLILILVGKSRIGRKPKA